MFNDDNEEALVLTKLVDSNYWAFWLAPVSWNILGYSLFCKCREKWRVVSPKFQKKKSKKRSFIHLINLYWNSYPFRVGEEWWIYTSMLCISIIGIISTTSHLPFGDSCILSVVVLIHVSFLHIRVVILESLKVFGHYDIFQVLQW